MACLPNWRKTLLIAKRDKLIAQITILDDVYTDALSTGKISSYKLNTGAGEQQTSYRNLNELKKALDALEIELARVFNKLCCRGVVNLGLRRYNTSRGR
jgi:hypothetical protein